MSERETEQLNPAWLRKKILISVSSVLWLGIVGCGLFLMANYASSPGTAAHPSRQFPANSLIRQIPDRPTLIMLAHPHCPCTRASIGELALLMAQSQKDITAYVLFLKPAELKDDWSKTDLWQSASEIPGVKVIEDEDGKEAAFFDGETSGQTFLYDTKGQLLFTGGITSARGHAGDNAGRSAIISLLNNGKADQTETSVYGCSLFSPNSDCKKSQ